MHKYSLILLILFVSACGSTSTIVHDYHFRGDVTDEQKAQVIDAISQVNQHFGCEAIR